MNVIKVKDFGTFETTDMLWFNLLRPWNHIYRHNIRLPTLKYSTSFGYKFYFLDNWHVALHDIHGIILGNKTFSQPNIPPYTQDRGDFLDMLHKMTRMESYWQNILIPTLQSTISSGSKFYFLDNWHGKQKCLPPLQSSISSGSRRLFRHVA